MFPFSLFGFNVTLTMAKYILIALVIGFFVWVYPNSDSIQAFFGMETKTSLKKTVTEQAQQLLQTKTTNTEMVTALEKCQAIAKLNLDAASDMCKKEKEINQTSDQFETERQRALNDLLKKAKVDKTTKPSTATMKESIIMSEFTDDQAESVSTIQLSSIWKVYCRGNTNKDCEAEIGEAK